MYKRGHPGVNAKSVSYGLFYCLLVALLVRKRFYSGSVTAEEMAPKLGPDKINSGLLVL